MGFSQQLENGDMVSILCLHCKLHSVTNHILFNVSGFPNVGKSSLINSLKRARACNVGATPGVTKCV